jgi:hypothetical protein
MDGKQAYKNGDYAKQYAAMNANNYALENAGLNYTLWCYCSNVIDISEHGSLILEFT